MRNKTIRILLAFLSMAILSCATPAKKEVNKQEATEPPETLALMNFDVNDYEMMLNLNGELKSQYTVNKKDPYTVIVELPGVYAGGNVGTVDSKKEGFEQINVSEDIGPPLVTTMEILLVSPLDVDSRVEGNTFLISLKQPEVPEPEIKEEPAEAAGPEEQGMLPAEQIYDLAFSRLDDTLKFEIVGDGTMSPALYRLQEKIIIDIPNVEMKAELPEKVIAPVKFVRQGMYEGNVRFVIGIKENTRIDASTVENKIIIAMPLETEEEAPAAEVAEAEEAPGEEVKEMPFKAGPVPEGEVLEEAELTEEGECTKRISLDFQDADIVPIFRFIGDICGYNVVIHPNVRGTINLKLLNVPANQALDIIMELTNLGKDFREEGRILTIANTDVFTKQKEEEAKLKQLSARVDMLVEKSFSLRYINAADMMDIVNKKKALSPRGTFYIDEVTNTLELRDTAEYIKDMGKLIDKYDDRRHGTMQHGPMAQIMIEAKMVEVSTDYSRALGIRWGGSATNDDIGFIDDESSYDISVNTPVAEAGADASAAGGIISIGYTETFEVNMSLEALESIGKTRALANPRVLTLNKQAANIAQGVQIPYTVVEDGTAKTEFQSATLSLNVTPEIKPNDFVELQVSASNDTPTQVGSDIGINTQTISTKARVKNGETLVLGGIYTNTESETETGVPLLSKIPLFGWLFKTQSVSDSPKELLIFITPKIIK